MNDVGIVGSPMDEPKVKGKKGDPRVILVGPSDAGKTTIFTKVRHTRLVLLTAWYMLTHLAFALSLSSSTTNPLIRTLPSNLARPSFVYRIATRPSSSLICLGILV
jgi:hypothetical protein